MPAVSFFYASFCQHGQVIDGCARELGCSLYDDDWLIRAAAEGFDVPEDTVRGALYTHQPSFNRFTHEKEKSVAALKSILAGLLQEDRLVVSGFCSHLIPRTISHVLRVHLALEGKARIRNAVNSGMTKDQAAEAITSYDMAAARWADYLYLKSPWSNEQYDLILPMDKKSVDDAVATVVRHARKDLFRPSPLSRRAIEDFRLAAKVEIALAKEGYYVLVEAHQGNIDLSIPHNVIMLSRMGEELRRITMSVQGVVHVTIRPDPNVPFKGKHRDQESRMRLLLVDDEKEFVHTLSERLFMREIGSAVVYDGEQALSYIESEQPEVIVLDLKMPGMDGIEVLRRVMSTHPEIQVIILTGHGSHEDEKACMALGAFAYLQKPVDIDILTGLLEKARLRP
jgi:two-component system, OmpR family, response regulator CpxR